MGVEYVSYEIDQYTRAVLIKKWAKKFEKTGSTLSVKLTGVIETKDQRSDVCNLTLPLPKSFRKFAFSFRRKPKPLKNIIFKT